MKIDNLDIEDLQSVLNDITNAQTSLVAMQSPSMKMGAEQGDKVPVLNCDQYHTAYTVEYAVQRLKVAHSSLLDLIKEFQAR